MSVIEDIDSSKIDQIWNDLESGKDFWEVIRRPYLARELNKGEVRNIVEEGFRRSGMKYTNLVSMFNLKEKEYKKFMNFLLVHKIRINRY